MSFLSWITWFLALALSCLQDRRGSNLLGFELDHPLPTKRGAVLPWGSRHQPKRRWEHDDRDVTLKFQIWTSTDQATSANPACQRISISKGYRFQMMCFNVVPEQSTVRQRNPSTRPKNPGALTQTWTLYGALNTSPLYTANTFIWKILRKTGWFSTPMIARWMCCNLCFPSYREGCIFSYKTRHSKRCYSPQP